MRDLQKELEAYFVGDKTKINLLAKLTTEEVEKLYDRINKIENALSLMQEAMVRMEIAYNTIKEDIYAKPKSQTTSKRKRTLKRSESSAVSSGS